MLGQQPVRRERLCHGGVRGQLARAGVGGQADDRRARLSIVGRALEGRLIRDERTLLVGQFLLQEARLQQTQVDRARQRRRQRGRSRRQRLGHQRPPGKCGRQTDDLAFQMAVVRRQAQSRAQVR